MRVGNLYEVEVTLQNSQGMHVRPAKLFVELAIKFSSHVDVVFKDLSANGKSIMGLLGLLAYKGCTLKIRATGDDAQEAVTALAKLVNSGFNEE
ncbi:HPr family phosphocarrier protein [Myxococcota bacterium]|nr:HPr family phosphocarrier protein [Myxococcota bacterium]MBU1534561.1 HPr family phosphocarrier protein [Myxococcota bacterium]